MTKFILAVVGLAGAGKTEATNYLFQKTGWPKVYFGQAVIDEVAKRGLPINEANEKTVREEFRAKEGMAAMAVVNLPKVKEYYSKSSILIESLYSWEEYVKLKVEFGDNFKVLAIFTSFNTRVIRLKVRSIRPLSEIDLQSRDYSQIEKLHQAGPIARADWTIINEGSKQELYKKIDDVLTNIKGK
jgi:dephospho-CoA kinase